MTLLWISWSCHSRAEYLSILWRRSSFCNSTIGRESDDFVPTWNLRFCENKKKLDKFPVWMGRKPYPNPRTIAESHWPGLLAGTECRKETFFRHRGTWKCFNDTWNTDSLFNSRDEPTVYIASNFRPFCGLFRYEHGKTSALQLHIITWRNVTHLLDAKPTQLALEKSHLLDGV